MTSFHQAVQYTSSDLIFALVGEDGTNNHLFFSFLFFFFSFRLHQLRLFNYQQTCSSVLLDLAMRPVYWQ
jgi:hypothetical protein